MINTQIGNRAQRRALDAVRLRLTRRTKITDTLLAKCHPRMIEAVRNFQALRRAARGAAR